LEIEDFFQQAEGIGVLHEESFLRAVTGISRDARSFLSPERERKIEKCCPTHNITQVKDEERAIRIEPDFVHANQVMGLPIGAGGKESVLDFVKILVEIFNGCAGVKQSVNDSGTLINGPFFLAHIEEETVSDDCPVSVNEIDISPTIDFPSFQVDGDGICSELVFFIRDGRSASDFDNILADGFYLEIFHCVRMFEDDDVLLFAGERGMFLGEESDGAHPVGLVAGLCMEGTRDDEKEEKKERG
jgi:hypothetical protein